MIKVDGCLPGCVPEASPQHFDYFPGGKWCPGFRIEADSECLIETADNITWKVGGQGVKRIYTPPLWRRIAWWLWSHGGYSVYSKVRRGE